MASGCSFSNFFIFCNLFSQSLVFLLKNKNEKGRVSMRKQQRKITAIILTLALAMGQLTVLPVEAASKEYVSDKTKAESMDTTFISTSASGTMVPAQANDMPIPETISMPEVGEQTETPGPIETVPPTGKGNVLHSGSYKKTKWKIYKNGLLEVKGTGNIYSKAKLEYGEEDVLQIAPSTGPGWYPYRNKIKSARIEVKGADATDMFARCNNLKQINTPKRTGSQVISLPEGVWRGSDGNSYQTIPNNATVSITLTKE